MKKFLCLIIIFLFIFPSIGLAGNDIICTVINDRILDISANTMPMRKDGQIYVPYTIFSSELGIKSSRNLSKETLVLYNIDYNLTYELISGNTYDEKLNNYSYSAMYHNGTIYVPITQVSNKFNLYTSMISYKTPVLRIAKTTPRLSDNDFLGIASSLIDSIVNSYNESKNIIVSPNTPIPNTPGSTDDIKPSKLYLTFSGILSNNTEYLLKKLNDYNIKATFFIAPDDILKNDDLIRAIFASDHKLGIYLDDEINVLSNIKTANEHFDSVLGAKTRLVKLKTNAASSSISQQGYFVWQDNLISPSDDKIKRIFSQSAKPLSINFNYSKNISKTLSLINALNIHTTGIYDSDSLT